MVVVLVRALREIVDGPKISRPTGPWLWPDPSPRRGCGFAVCSGENRLASTEFSALIGAGHRFSWAQV